MMAATTIEERAARKKTREELKRSREEKLERYRSTMAARPQARRAEAEAGEREWASSLQKTEVKARQVIRRETLGNIFEELLKRYIRISDKTPKDIHDTYGKGQIKKLAQPVFAAIQRVINIYLKKGGDDKNKNFLLIKDMENYWAGLADSGKLPWMRRARYNKQSIGLQLTSLSGIERNLKNSLKGSS